MAFAARDRYAFPRNWATAAVVMTALGAGGGCTICPDPFDYSGPVPNGSAPQNDFRARSGGILPLSAAPKPWPQVVKTEGDPAVSPAIAEADSGSVAESDATAVQSASVLVAGGAGDCAPDEAESGPQPESAVEDTTVPLQPVPAGDGPEATPPFGGEPQPAADRQPALPEPPTESPETPGWRPRRR